MKCLRLTWKGGEVKDHHVGRRGAWDECNWKVVVKDHSSSGGMMKSRTIHVGTRRDERGAEQEDEEDGRLSTSTVSLQSRFLKKKANCSPDFRFQSGPYHRILDFSFQ